jgi:hypothetical protein
LAIKINGTENLYPIITDLEILFNSYKKAIVGDEKNKREAIRFSQDVDNNISQLRNELINKTYEFSGYNIFTVYEPKERVIAAPHFRDKVVQLAINDILKLFYNKKFIYDSYACIDNKGTHRCARRINKFMKEAQWKWGQ